MFELMEDGLVGIDLAGKQQNPTSWALWKGSNIKACLVYTGEEMLQKILECVPILVAIDAPFGFFKGRNSPFCR
jgi:predicted nuclease with RNAse H fold